MRANDAGLQMTTFTIDPEHSIVEFAVQHMQVSTVKGRLLDIKGELHIDEGAPSASWVEVTINASSIDTGVKQRDEHLRSLDFLNARLHPRIRFRSDKVEQVEGPRWRVEGTLTLHGVSRRVVLDATLEGRLIDVEGTERIGFSAETTLNRRDYGINWSGWMGRYLVADEVRVSINLEASRRGHSAPVSF